MTDQQINDVHDAIFEAAVVRPELAAEIGLSSAAYREAMTMIPDEYHRPGRTLRERFIASVIANAADMGISPYTMACFALDLA